MVAKTVLDTRVLCLALTLSSTTPAALCKQLGVSRATLHRKLKILIDEGLVSQEGSGPSSTYRLKSVQEMQAQSQPAVPEPPKVHLEMSRRTAALVALTLENYARLGIGQFEQVLDMARMDVLKRADGSDITPEQIDQAEADLNRCKRTLLGLAPNASFGIYAAHLDAGVKEAWAVHKAIRHRLAWDAAPEGQGGVAHDEPLDGEAVPGLAVHSAPDRPHLVDISEVPAGMMMQFKGGQYRIIGPTADGEAFELVGESRSWQTAISKAKNVVRARNPPASK